MSWWPSYTGPWSRCTPRRLHSWGTCYSRPASSHVAAPLEQEKEMKWKINWNHFLVNKKLFQLSTWHWFPLYRICKEKYFSFQGSELRLGHSKKSIFQTASLASNLLLLLALHLMHLCGWKIGSVKKKTESYHQRIKSSTLHFIFRYLLYQFWVLPLKQNQMRQHLYRSEVDLSVCQSIGLRILNNILKGFNVVVLSHNIYASFEYLNLASSDLLVFFHWTSLSVTSIYELLDAASVVDEVCALLDGVLVLPLRVCVQGGGVAHPAPAGRPAVSPAHVAPQSLRSAHSGQQ